MRFPFGPITIASGALQALHERYSIPSVLRRSGSATEHHRFFRLVARENDAGMDRADEAAVV